MSLEVPEWQKMPWYNLTPTPAPSNATVLNETVAPAPSLPCPAPIPTPLPAGVSRERAGMSAATMASMLLGLACAGFVAYLGYLMIKK